jgi:hypothetical protein
MDYTPQTSVDDSTPVSAELLNNFDAAISGLATNMKSIRRKLSQALEYGVMGYWYLLEFASDTGAEYGGSGSSALISNAAKVVVPNGYTNVMLTAFVDLINKTGTDTGDNLYRALRIQRDRSSVVSTLASVSAHAALSSSYPTKLNCHIACPCVAGDLFYAELFLPTLSSDINTITTNTSFSMMIW